MSRLVRRKVEVTVNEYREPVTITDGDRTYIIEMVIDWWKESGAWWENEPHRYVYRVVTEESYMYDLEYTVGEWFIYRVWD
jgi:hypothetical protein